MSARVSRSRPREAFAPKWNFYRCNNCSEFLVTVDVVAGVTPSQVRCRAKGRGATEEQRNCPGTMHSGFYPAPNLWPAVVPRTPYAEWYKPSTYHLGRIKKKHPDLYQHIIAGGLIMRPAADGWVFPEPEEQ